MRIVLLGMCALFGAGVFAAMLLAIKPTRRRTSDSLPVFRQSFATELVWAAIPCLMILAAAIFAMLPIVSSHPAG